jgi:DHA2 family multidrug resistance protein
VQPRILVVLGVLLVGFSTFLMAHYTLDTSAATVTGAIVIQGFGFAAIFVPLTTVALAGIPRYRLTDATGLNSLLRQIGGSLGLAAFATWLPRFEAQAQVGLAAHVVAGRPDVIGRLARIQQGLIGRGLDPGDARAAAQRMLGGVVTRQAAVIAFERMFLVAGIAFMFVLPLALFLRAPRGVRAPKAELH